MPCALGLNGPSELPKPPRPADGFELLYVHPHLKRLFLSSVEAKEDRCSNWSPFPTDSHAACLAAIVSPILPRPFFQSFFRTDSDFCIRTFAVSVNLAKSTSLSLLYIILGNVTAKYFLISHVPLLVESFGYPTKSKKPSSILIAS